MASLKESISSFLLKMGMEDGKVASLFNEDGTELKPEAVNELIQFDATRVQKIKAEGTKLFDQGHQKGKADALEGLEKQIIEKYGIDSDKKGTELIDAIITSKAGAKIELEEDKVKIHPAYIKMQDELTKKAKQVETDWKTKYEDRDKQIAKESTFKTIREKALQLVKESKYILPADPKKAENQLRLLEIELQKFEYQDNNGDYVITAEGKVVEDEHGNRKNFETIVKSIANNYWDVESGQQRSTPGNNNDQSGAGKGTGLNVKTPKNEQEYIKFIGEAKTPEERMAIDDAYSKFQSGNV